MIIVLQGKPGSGKGTAANYLINHLGFETHKIATRMKNMLRVGFGLTDEHIEGKLKRVPTPLLGGRTPVHAMRTLGGEWRDLVHPDLWMFGWETDRPDCQRIVIDDNRYQQEIKYLRDYAARRGEQISLIRIDRPSGEGDDFSEHMAENQKLEYDVIISNVGSIALLESKLLTIISDLSEIG